MKAKKGHGWTKLERIEMDCILDKFEKRRPTFFHIFGMSAFTCIKISLTQLENHSQ